VRDVLFHPYKPLLFTCADDARINIYTQSTEAVEVEDTGRRRRTTANKDNNHVNGQADTAPKKPKGKVGRPRGSKKANSLAASTNSIEDNDNNTNNSTMSLLASTESMVLDLVNEETPNLQANENLEIQNQNRAVFRASTGAESEAGEEKKD